MSAEVPIIILILSIPIYFCCKWVLKKWNIGDENNRKFLAIVPTVILSPILYLGVVFLFIFWISYYPSNNFDQQLWKSMPEERYKMSEDLVEGKELIGKTKQEVIELLGSEYSSYSKNHMAYYIGFVPGLFNIDPDVLNIYFEDSKVVKVSQNQT
ncbi:hypothetical protein [uncultured Dokdonia sp.]|uniref:hypothetical protein n=1 Tax=uncultured Dokdonia sp. TaxID=575653 RepID=UPI00261F70FB|nr:hypothetical protein [uncultured Dokdonia sp.]